MKKWTVPGVVVLVLAAFGTRYFGATSQAKLRNFTNQSGKTIVAFGDSLTEGFGASSPQMAYPAQLSALLNTEVINLGKDGETTQSALARVPQVLEAKPNYVLVTLGGNDLRQRVELAETLSNLETLFKELQSSGAAVAYLSINPPLVGDNWVMAIEQVARANGVLWVEDIMKGLWDNPEMMADAMHPNDKGYTVVAGRVEKSVAPYLQ